MQSRRQVRGRPEKYDDWRRMLKKKYKGDLKGDKDAGLEMSDYDVISLHIPYGPGWDAKRIEKLVYTTDLGMNCEFVAVLVPRLNRSGRDIYSSRGVVEEHLEQMQPCRREFSFSRHRRRRPRLLHSHLPTIPLR